MQNCFYQWQILISIPQLFQIFPLFLLIPAAIEPPKLTHQVFFGSYLEAWQQLSIESLRNFYALFDYLSTQCLNSYYEVKKLFIAAH